MSMQSTKLYLRLCEANNKLYTTGYKDEEKFKDAKEQQRMLNERKWGTYEELMKMHHYRPMNSTMVYEVVDERAPSFREKWVPFKQDRVEGFKKGEKVLTQEMMELLGYDGRKSLKETTNMEKDVYYRLIACKVLRTMADQEKMKQA